MVAEAMAKATVMATATTASWVLVELNITMLFCYGHGQQQGKLLAILIAMRMRRYDTGRFAP
jgi:hypothetical protein